MHLLTRRPLNLLLVVFIVISPFFLFWRWLVKGEVLFWGTSFLQFWPWHYLVKASLLNGEWPLWNPLLGNGTPLLANLQTAVFYPLNFIYFLMPVEHALTFSVILHLLLAGLLMYFYARYLGLLPFAATISALCYMCSGYLIGRTQFVTMINAAAWFPLLLLLSDKVATKGAGINILWLTLVLAVQLLAGHAQLWFYGLWLIGMYTLFRSWQTANRRIESQHTNEPVTSADLRATNLPVARNTQFHTERSRRNTLRFKSLVRSISKLAIAVSLSLLLAAVQILPTAEFVSQSQRSTGADRIFALTYSFWPWRLITLLAPDFFGNPAQGNYWGYANYWEDHAYVGVLPFILALAAVWYYFKHRVWRKNQRSRAEPSPSQITKFTQPLHVVPFFAILIPLSLLLAMGWNTPIYLWVFDNIPGFDFFQAPARLLIWYTIAMAVLAGLGAQFFESTAENRPNWRRMLAACVALTAAGFIGAYFLTGRELTFLDATKTAGIGLIFSITLLLIRPEAGYPNPIRETMWQWLVIIFIAVDLFRAAWPLLPTMPTIIFSQPIASAEFLKTRAENHRYFVDDRFAHNTIFNEYFRFKAFGSSDINYWRGLKETLVPNFGVYAGLASANNDDPLVVGHWHQLTQQLDTIDSSQRAKLLALMNVGYFINFAIDDTGPAIYHKPAFLIQDVPNTLPRAYFVSQAYYAADNSAAMTRLTSPDFDSHREVVIMIADDERSLATNSPTTSNLVPLIVNEQGFNHVQLTVNVPSPGFVVLTDTFYPGWQATVDGQGVKIWQANLAFRAVAVDAGQHEIGFSYRPHSFMFGLWTSLITSFLITVFIGRLLVWRHIAHIKKTRKL